MARATSSTPVLRWRPSYDAIAITIALVVSFAVCAPFALGLWGCSNQVKDDSSPSGYRELSPHDTSRLPELLRGGREMSLCQVDGAWVRMADGESAGEAIIVWMKDEDTGAVYPYVADTDYCCFLWDAPSGRASVAYAYGQQIGDVNYGRTFVFHLPEDIEPRFGEQGAGE